MRLRIRDVPVVIQVRDSREVHSIKIELQKLIVIAEELFSLSILSHTAVNSRMLTISLSGISADINAPFSPQLFRSSIMRLLMEFRALSKAGHFETFLRRRTSFSAPKNISRDLSTRLCELVYKKRV